MALLHLSSRVATLALLALVALDVALVGKALQVRQGKLRLRGA